MSILVFLLAHSLTQHIQIAGPKSTTEPQPGFDTKTRVSPLSVKVVDNIINQNLDPNQNLLYNPLNWADAKNVQFPKDKNWLSPAVEETVNGRSDAFSQRRVLFGFKLHRMLTEHLKCRLGAECQPLAIAPPAERLFDPAKVVIIGNGKCASSCSIFSVCISVSQPISAYLALVDHYGERRGNEHPSVRWQERCQTAILWYRRGTVDGLCYH